MVSASSIGMMKHRTVGADLAGPHSTWDVCAAPPPVVEGADHGAQPSIPKPSIPTLYPNIEASPHGALSGRRRLIWLRCAAVHVNTAGFTADSATMCERYLTIRCRLIEIVTATSRPKWQISDFRFQISDFRFQSRPQQISNEGVSFQSSDSRFQISSWWHFIFLFLEFGKSSMGI